MLNFSSVVPHAEPTILPRTNKSMDFYHLTKVRKLRIILFDPNRLFSMLEMLLSNYRVTSDTCFLAKNAEEILFCMNQNHYDAIIFDMDHVDSAKLLQLARRRFPISVPVIGITSLKGNRDALLEQGVNAVFLKPINGEEIVDAVYKLRDHPKPPARDYMVIDQGLPQSNDSRALHILLVDDSSVCLKILSKLLVNSGFRVTLCNNGQSSLDFLGANRSDYDIVIIDIYMPEISGIVVAATCRHKLKCDIPIIMMSSSEELKEEAMFCADAFLKKPITKAELGAAIETVLPKVKELEKQTTVGKFSQIIKRMFGNNKVGVSDDISKGGACMIMSEQPLKAMLIDDSQVCLKFMGRSMSNLGYDVDLFLDGNEALSHMLKNANSPYDVIVLDICMPHICGLKLIDICRVNLFIKCPIVVISSYAEKRDMALRLGADCFLLKPVSREDIIGTFTSYMATVAEPVA